MQSFGAGFGAALVPVKNEGRAKRAKFFAKGAITGGQIVVPHHPESVRGVIVPRRKRAG